MEGFLLKKARGESGFGRRNWKRRWFILEDQSLKYFEDFNLRTSKPVNLKGTTDIVGCEVVPLQHQDKKFCFMINHPNSSPMYLQAEDEKLYSTWMKAFAAATSDDFSKSKLPDYPHFYSILGLDIASNPSLSEINRAYRKAALKVHPDKGGDLAEFKKLQEAFDSLVLKLEEEENNKLLTILLFEAKIVKGPAGVGLGMIVTEDAKTGAVTVKSVTDSIMVKSITAGAGSIQSGDVMVKIENDDVTNMPLLRVIQKISDFRVPVNSAVRITFSRKIKKEPVPADDDVEEKADYKEPPSPQASPTGSSSYTDSNMNDSNKNNYNSKRSGESEFTQDSNNSHSSARSGNNNNNNGDSTPTSNTNRNSSANGNNTTSNASNTGITEDNQYINPSFSSSPSHLNPVQYVAVMAENEELKNELEALTKQLENAKIQKEEQQKELVRLQEVNAETIRAQKLLELMLEQQYLLKPPASSSEPHDAQGGKAIPAEENSKPMPSVEALLSMVSDAVLKKQVHLLKVAQETNSYLQKVGLSEAEAKGSPLKSAHRQSIIAAATMDRTGKLLQKWEWTGDPVLNKLLRLEDSLQIAEAKSQQQKAALDAITNPNSSSSVATSNPVAPRKVPLSTAVPATSSSPVVEPPPLKRTVSKIIAERMSNISNPSTNNSSTSATPGILTAPVEEEAASNSLSKTVVAAAPAPTAAVNPQPREEESDSDPYQPSSVEHASLLRGFNRQQSMPSSNNMAPKFNYIKPTASSTTRLKQQQHQYQGLTSNSEDVIEHFSPVHSSTNYNNNINNSSINYTPTNPNAKKGVDGFGPASNRNQMNTIHVTPISVSAMRGKAPVVHPTQR